VSRVPTENTLFNNTSVDLLAVAGFTLDGELEYRKGNHEAAFVLLRQAVARDDNLVYDEPWGWMQPPRHALGALLLEQGHVAEAKQVYETDLHKRPKNCWSLVGLLQCLRSLGDTVHAVKIEKDLQDAKARADVPVKASCFCMLSAF